ncbi:hypothetical protein [Saccharopolyspora sp. ASAGF58]|uniref:hypothetical protein n=1 Tax=Saccharopolyspora sp. ASAGF58 TaxID=2719023 RepID=UPI001FF0CD62|nr:hypothetical protein [Saccharopolyspora sp. ASAGF58]
MVWHQPVQFGYRLPSPGSELEQRAREALDAAVTAVKADFPAVDLRSRLIRGQVVPSRPICL